jgi:threonine dehydrogenase-like Zn-dependent dehydrogenase
MKTIEPIKTVGTMKAIVNTGPGQLAWQDWSLPQPGAGQVRIRTGACAMCATDLQMIAGWERTGFPSIPGHEWSGTVDAVGAGADPGLAGRRCVAENVLADGGEVGFEHPGGYAAYLLTEARNVQLLPPDFPLTAAALIEPLAVSVRGMRRLRLENKPEEERRALVFGDGPIGLLTLMLLRRAGVEDVLLVGGRSQRLALARELGAGRVLNYHEVSGDLAAAVRRAGGGQFPNVVEASGSAAALQTCLEVVTRCGRVLVLGDYHGARADFAWNHLLHREIELIGSNASAGAWPEAVRMATGGQLPLARLVTHRLPAARFAEGVELMRSHQADVVKVVLEW